MIKQFYFGKYAWPQLQKIYTKYDIYFILFYLKMLYFRETSMLNNKEAFLFTFAGH